MMVVIVGSLGTWSRGWNQCGSVRPNLILNMATATSKHCLLGSSHRGWAEMATDHRHILRTSPDGQHQNQIGYILCSWRCRSSIQSAKTRTGADCSSDHELLVAKFRLKLKKVGKTIRPFGYDLNQIPYVYTVEVTNRFKGLDLVDRDPEELWTEARDIVQAAVIKTIPKKKKCKKAKCLFEEALQNFWEEKRSERQRRKKERYTHLNAEFQKKK